MSRIIVAIDGFSSTGKSTLAKQLAAKLGYTYIDSGAMYRAITLYFLDHQVNWKDEEQVKSHLAQIRLHFEKQRIHLNGKDVEEPIRTLAVAQCVSEVSAIPLVREFAVSQQQLMGKRKGIVMDGRDIGTTVFPEAEFKIYLCADESVRAERRYQEMFIRNPEITLEDVLQNLRHRDLIDSTRLVSPLRQATDAVVLDNSALTMEQQLAWAYRLARERID